MAYGDAGLASGYILRLTVNVSSQSIPNNTTTYSYSLVIHKGTGSGKWADGPHYWSVNTPAGNAINHGSIGSYDFRNYSALTLASGSITIAGSASRQWTGVFDDNNTWGELGDGTAAFWVAPPTIPVVPSGLTVTRVSDAQHTLNWVGASNSTVVHRATDGGAWQEVGRPGGSPTSWTDTTTAANRRYQYWVANIGGAGQSAWSSTVEVFTTPAPVATVSAARVGMDIQVTVSGLPPYATAYDIYDGAALVGSAVTAFPWLHAAPNPANPHTYTVRSRRGALVSAASPQSNTVQLQAPPNPPTGLTPNGGVAASDGAVRLAWVHNPVDTSAQSSYELRHRPVGGTWANFPGATAGFRDVTFGLGSFEWQVRTKGDDPGWSDWSAVATVEVITRPGVAVIQPTPVWGEPVLPVEWTWLQAQGRPQSAWRVELLDSVGVRVEFREGSGPQTSHTITHHVEHDQTYTVRVWGATGEIWSLVASQYFRVEFVEPAPASFEGSWDEGTGSVGISVGDGRGAIRPDIINRYLNPSFENPVLIPAGAERSSEWAFQGGYSLFVPSTTGYGHGPYGHGVYGHGPE